MLNDFLLLSLIKLTLSRAMLVAQRSRVNILEALKNIVGYSCGSLVGVNETKTYWKYEIGLIQEKATYQKENHLQCKVRHRYRAWEGMGPKCS